MRSNSSARDADVLVSGAMNSKDRIRLGLVGCGGMGTRHLYGLRELARTPFDNVELCALCDIRRENAELAAREAERLLGVSPAIFTDLEEMARRVPELAAVDVVTDPATHHTVVCQALELGLHVLVEKPMAITVRACRKMLEAAERSGCVLSVAENFRRDPSSRLVHHLLQSGAIGKPYMGVFEALSPGNAIFITPWRHRKEKGGFILDMAVHFTHMIRYQLGEIEEVYGEACLVEPVRRKPAAVVSGDYEFYRRSFAAMEAEIQAEAEDTTQALLRLASGATVSWTVGISGHGSSARELILGEGGSIEGFGTRGGRIKMRQGGAERGQEEIAAGRDGYAPDPLTSHLFPSGVSAGDERVDWKLIAWELHELAEAILDGKAVEVDGLCGLRDVAALYAIFESSRVGRAVKLSEVEDEQAYVYQAEIDATLGIS